MKWFRSLIIALTLLGMVSAPTWAEKVGGNSLGDVFDQTVVIPVDFKNKVFYYGELMDIDDDYQLYQKNGRILVPIRLMSFLASGGDQDQGNWEAFWESQKPNEVILINHTLQKTVQLTVNSKTMYINGEPKILDVPPEVIGGRIVLPLRSISEALGRQIIWIDGLIIISNEVFDLKHPRTLEVARKVKITLLDQRQRVVYQASIPLTQYKDTLYYIKASYKDEYSQQLVKKTTGQQEEIIKLPGATRFISQGKILNDELYYIAAGEGNAELHSYSFTNNQISKRGILGEFIADDCRLIDLRLIDDEVYMVVHYGDFIAGGSSLYKLKYDSLQKIAQANGFIAFTAVGDYLYYANFSLPFGFANNLFKVNMENGETENVGENGFVYNIVKAITAEGGTSYSGSSSFYLVDNYLYTLGYQENFEGGKSSIYRIDLDDNKQERLSSPATAFWLVDNSIYYLDASTGYLMGMDLEGTNLSTVIDKRIIDLQIFNGTIYYTAASKKPHNAKAGILYQYNIARGQGLKLSDKAVRQFFLGPTGVYYIVEGYDSGLYKIDGSGKNICLVEDNISTALLTEEGIVYTLRYGKGVHTAK